MGQSTWDKEMYFAMQDCWAEIVEVCDSRPTFKFGSSLNHVVEGTTPRHKMGHVSIILLFLPVLLICGSNSTENHTASTASPPNSTTPAEVDSNSSMTTTTTTPTMTTVNQKLVAMVTIPENYTAEP